MIWRALGVVALFCVLPACGALPAVSASEATLDVAPLQVITQQGKTHKFEVEVARSEEEQNRGLMFRDLLPPGKGMVFPLNPPRFASFWMKNCPVAIDMLFIRQDGTIARIATGVPYSVDPVESGETVSTVLEIRGGGAAELGISEGDTVRWTDSN